MKKNCLLLAPPNTGRVLPRGLLEIASFLESRGQKTVVVPLSHLLEYDRSYPFAGHGTRHFDYPFKEKRQWVHEEKAGPVLKDLIETTDPAVVGVSNQFTKDVPDCLRILEICKKITSDIVTVIGGPHVTFQDTVSAQYPFVDVVVRGEGEWTMLELLSAVENGEQLKNVKGITFKENNRIFRTPDRPLGDLRELPPIDFKLLPSEFVKNAYLTGMLNRGCAFNCAFCVEKAFWRKRRIFPVQRLLDEMKTLAADHGNTFDAVEDSMLYIGSDQCFELCSKIEKQGVDISSTLYIQSRVDTVTSRGVRALKAAGIPWVYLGIESVSGKTLTAMNKNISFDQVIAACETLRKNNIRVGSYWIIGHPGDTPREADRSLEAMDDLFSNDLIQDAEVALFIPYPGTPFFDRPQKYGIKILTRDWSAWERWSNEPVSELSAFPADEITARYKKAIKIKEAHQKINLFTQSSHEFEKRAV